MITAVPELARLSRIEHRRLIDRREAGEPIRKSAIREVKKGCERLERAADILGESPHDYLSEEA